MSWIHVEDLIRLILWAIQTPGVRGPLNAVAPEPVRNVDFTATLAKTLRRPAIFPIPKMMLKLTYGEMSQLLTMSQRVLPAAAQRHGFEFRYPDLGETLHSLLY